MSYDANSPKSELEHPLELAQIQHQVGSSIKIGPAPGNTGRKVVLPTFFGRTVSTTYRQL